MTETILRINLKYLSLQAPIPSMGLVAYNDLESPIAQGQESRACLEIDINK